jgi:PAS domain S-box-containing protein
MLGHGIVGGRLSSGKEQGGEAGKLALRLLRGEKAEDLPWRELAPGRFGFDHRQLARFGIKSSQLPAGSEVRYQPAVSFYVRYRFLLLAMVLIFAAQLAVIVSLISNIARRRRTSAELRDREEDLRTTLESLREAVITTDPAGKVMRVNRCAARLTGWTEGEARGRPLDEIFHMEDEHSGLPVERPLDVLVHAPATVDLSNPVRLRSREGESVPIAPSAAPIRSGSGEDRGVVLVFRDQTEERAAQSALQESEERAHALLSAVPDEMLVLDREGTVLECEPKEDSLLVSLFPDGLVNRKLQDLLPLDLGEQVMAHLRVCHQTGDRQQHEFDWPDGAEARHWEARYVACGPNRVLAILRDRSEEWRSARALEEEKGIFVGGPAVVFKWQAAPGWPIEYVSPNVTSQFGYLAEKLTRAPATFVELIHPEDRARVVTDRQAYTTAGAPSYEHEYRIVRNDGVYRWVHDFTVVVRDNAGAVSHYHGYLLDITDRVQAEEKVWKLNTALEQRVQERTAQLETLNRQLKNEVTARERAETAWRSQSHFLQTILDAVPSPIFYKDTAGVYLGCNRAFEQYAGLPRNEIVGKQVQELFSKEVADMHQSADNALYEKGGAQQYEATLPVKAGAPREAMFHKACFQNPEGALGGLVGVILDITQRKNMESHISALNEDLRRHAAELEAANQELEAFSFSVSHDLRAPLRAIDGFALALNDDYGPKLDERGRDYLRRVRSGAQRMGQLIEDLLTLSRVARGELHRESVDLSSLAHGILEALRAREPQRNVQVSVAEKLRVEADPRLVRIALENLLQNAWKFTGRMTEARIEVGLLPFGAPDSPSPFPAGPVFFVRDNGAGFDMAYVDKLFGAFQRLHPTAEFSGTGIGLATVRRIIRRHGGRIWAKGAVNAGATFYFSL